MKQIKASAVSDLHGNLNFDVPECDILAIAGDICPVRESHHPVHQRHWLERTFYPWCESLVSSGPARHVVFTPGNHDFVFEAGQSPEAPQGVTCLIDRAAEIQGVKFYGTPWSVRFGRWAFMADDAELVAKYKGIPEGLDVLISHGPAYGLCDTVLSPAWPGSPGQPLGSRALRTAIERVKPRRVLCGHIHTGSHDPVFAIPWACSKQGVEVVNVSLLDESYAPAYRPFEFTVAKED